MLICPITPTVVSPHDTSGADITEPFSRTITVNGGPCDYLDNLAWPGLITVTNLPATVVSTRRLIDGLPIGGRVVGPYLEDKTPTGARFKEIISASEEHERQGTAEKKTETRAKQRAALERRRKHIRLTPNFQGEHLDRIDDPDFIASIRAYRDRTETMFRRLEGVRITIAKHEIPKTGKYQMLAEHPGYTRFDTVFTGSAYWQFTLKDDTIDVVQRRELANEFLRITEDPEREEMLPARTGPKRTRRVPRRKARSADRGKKP